LHKLLNKHAIYFPEAYSSATMTVAGQYSVLCSEFCSMEGPPVYQASPNLDVKCLQSVFADNGYRTMWMNPFHRFFAGKYVFEVSHGMREFYDRDDFKPRDDAEKSRAGEWGIDDRAFLDQALKKLVAANAAGRPFFAHLLTTGTHAPWNRPYSENTVSAELLEKTQANHDYQGYIKAVTLLDAALDDFFAKLFASPIGDNTVVMLVSDHGLTVEPSYPHVTVVQRSQLLSRIMFAVVSKNTARPRVDHVPVHQIDIAPLLATIAEVKADTSWLGRDPTLGSGTPYVVEYGSRLQYRTRDRYCAQLPEVDRVACWAASAVNDPLIALAVPEVAADQQITDNFRNVVRANEALIASGSMMGSHVECRECPLRRDRR
jgi:phosphoglycerol transferase MdoB-like AlkP superfamily enzyme